MHPTNVSAERDEASGASTQSNVFAEYALQDRSESTRDHGSADINEGDVNTDDMQHALIASCKEK